MGDKKIVGNLKISFQNSSRNKQLLENKEQFRKVKDYLENNFSTSQNRKNKRLIDDRYNLQTIFDEVRQVVEKESDLEFIEIKSDSEESSCSLQSTVASYNIYEVDDDVINSKLRNHGNTTEINKTSNITIDQLKIDFLSHNIEKRTPKLEKYNLVENYLKNVPNPTHQQTAQYFPKPNGVNDVSLTNTGNSFSKSEISNGKISPKSHNLFPKPVSNEQNNKIEKEKEKHLLIKDLIQDILPKSPEPYSTTLLTTNNTDVNINPTSTSRSPTVVLESTSNTSRLSNLTTNTSSVKAYKELQENKRMDKLREEYFNFKLSKRDVISSPKPHITEIYETALHHHDDTTSTRRSTIQPGPTAGKTFSSDFKRDDFILPCKQNPSKLFHSSNDIKYAKDEYDHHEYTIHEIRNKIKNNTSRVQKKILKLNLLNANANRPTTLINRTGKKVIKNDEKSPVTSEKDLIVRQTMIDNYFNYAHNKQSLPYFPHGYKKADYNQITYFDDGYGSESNRTYSSSVSQSMDMQGFTDLINSDPYAKNPDPYANNSSLYIDSYNDGIMSTANTYSQQPPPLHKRYSKSQSALDHLMTRNSRESKYHDEEAERENRKTIHGKLENLLKEKVKSMNDLNKAATLPPKKYKQNYAPTRPLDKTKTLPSNYMQEHVFNQLYGNVGHSELNLAIESDEEQYEPTPIRSSIPPGLSKPPAIYQSGGSDSKDAALRESMLSELKKTVKGRSMKQKGKAENLFSPTRRNTRSLKHDESETRIQRRQQKMAGDTIDASKMAEMNVLNDFDLMNASFERENFDRVTKENYQQQSHVIERPRSQSHINQHIPRDYPRDTYETHGHVGQRDKRDALVQRTSLPPLNGLRENKQQDLHLKNSARSHTSEPSSPRQDDDIYLFDSFPLPKNFTLPNHSKPTSPSISSKTETQNSKAIASEPPSTNQVQRRSSMRLDTDSKTSRNSVTRSDDSLTDLSPTDLEIKSILEEHNNRARNKAKSPVVGPSTVQKSRHIENQQQYIDKTINNAAKKPPQNLGETPPRLSLIEKRTSNLSASTLTLSNKKMSEKIIQANVLKNNEEKRRPKSAADVRPNDSDILTTYILKESSPIKRENKTHVVKKPSVYDELTSKIIQAREYEKQEKSIEELRKEMLNKKKPQSTSLINLDEINKTPTREKVEAVAPTSVTSPTKSNAHEKFTRQTYTATNIGKVSIPKQFQNTDYRFSSPKSIRDQGISRSTPASPTKRARSFSFNNSRKSPVPRPKSTQSANTSRPSTPKFITNKIRSLFSPRSKRKSRTDVSSDVLLTDSDEFIARRTNMNRSIGNDGYEIDDIIDGLNGDLSDDGDDIDVDFITNQDWINQEQHMKIKGGDVKGNIDINNNNKLANGHAPNGHVAMEQKENKPRKTKPYIKGSLIPTSKNGSIQLKSKHGIGKVVVPDVFSRSPQTVGNRNPQQNKQQNLSKQSSTMSDRSDHSLQNGKIPNGEKSYVQSAAHVQMNGHVSNGHENIMMTRNRRMVEGPIDYV